MNMKQYAIIVTIVTALAACSSGGGGSGGGDSFTPWAAVETVRAGDSERADAFGAAVAVSGDYMLVGARQSDGAGNSSGSAYIFRRTESGWTRDVELAPSDLTDLSRFGYSVAIDGDYAVVGSPDQTAEQGRFGSAYIFERTSGGWRQVEKVYERTDTDGYGRGFGRAVAIEGEYAYIGAPGVNAHPNAGAVYVFQRRTAGWRRVARLTASDCARFDFFGNSLAIDDDTLIVGAVYTGVYAFYRSADGWSDGQEDARFPQDPRVRLVLGGPARVRSVAVSGDYAVVGVGLAEDVPEVDGSRGDGIAAVFRRDGAGWTRVGDLTPNAVVGRDYYGSAVTMYGDYAVASAFRDDQNDLPNSGSVYVFRREGAQWSQFTALYSPNASENDNFGSAIAMDSGRLVVGSQWDNLSATELSRGAAFAWRYR